MTANPATPAARLFTTFGTVLFIDRETGELRHGPIDTSPANAVLVSDQGATGLRARIVSRALNAEDPVLCSADGCRATSNTGATGPLLELVHVERGLFGLLGEGVYLCAQPDGRVTLSRSVCSTWECFLASEAWCSRADAGSLNSRGAAAAPTVDRNAIKRYLISPMLRSASRAISVRPKILVYGYPQWSHGRVYYDLSKRLYDLGYLVDVLNWQEDHSAYIDSVTDYYDLVMTAPDGVRTLMDSYHVPPGKIIVVSHHEMDIRMLIEQKGAQIFDEFAGYGVVSPVLYSVSMMQGVRRPPMVASLGIDYEAFHSELPAKLDTVGYASSMSVTTYGVEWKRGHLAEAAAREAGLAFKVAGSTGEQMSFHDMPDFYRTVDAVLMSSISESGPLPVLEAAAAGRLVIGTPVGHFPLKAYLGGGIIAPIEADKFTEFAAKTLRHYKASPSAFADQCGRIQAAALGFDWRHSIGEWIDLVRAAQGEGPVSRRGAV